VEAGIGAAVAGLGIVRSLSYQISAHVASGKLKPLLDGDDAPRLPISLLFQSGRREAPNIRAFVDLARKRLPQQTM
jgi:DNA-binding transcriptional LysR family regulator